MKSTTILAKALILLLLPLFCAAEDSDQYQVNLVVFEHITQQNLASEHWPIISEPPPLDQATDVDFLPANFSALKNEAKKLATANNYKILLNASWLQEIPETKTAYPIHIYNEKTDDSQHQLNGTIIINKNRFFNIDINLLLSCPKSYLAEIGSGDYDENIVNKKYVTFQLHQTRRMKSDELNYIDHPLFGVLLKITKR